MAISLLLRCDDWWLLPGGNELLVTCEYGIRLEEIPAFHSQATPVIAELAVAAAALAGRYSIQVWQAYKARPIVPRMRKFYEGGFQPTMTRREADLILGVRENVHPEKVKQAHKKVMVANHPDAGRSTRRKMVC